MSHANDFTHTNNQKKFFITPHLQNTFVSKSIQIDW